jgi:hypothetical protein
VASFRFDGPHKSAETEIWNSPPNRRVGVSYFLTSVAGHTR